MLDEEFIAQQADMKRTPIEYVNMAGMVADIIEERHIKLTLPVAPIHLNHVGTAYAGSMFTLAEIAGGKLFKCTYGTDYVPILKAAEIRYLKPSTKDLVVELSLTEEEAAEKIALAAQRGRGDYFLDVDIKNIDGVLGATVHFNYYALSAEAAKSFGK